MRKYFYYKGLFILIGALVSPFIINLLGRRTLLSIGILLQGLSYLFLMGGIIFEVFFFSAFGVCLFMFFFAISLGGVLFLYRAEVLPPKLNMISSIFSPIASVLISFLTLDFIEIYGIFILFFTFWAITVVGWFFYEGLAVETRGKSDYEIIQNFKNKRFMD